MVTSVRLYGLGTVVGALVAMVLGQTYGRRGKSSTVTTDTYKDTEADGPVVTSLSAACLLVLAVPDLVGWVVAALASNLAMLHTSRLLAGTAAGGYILCIQVPG